MNWFWVFFLLGCVCKGFSYELSVAAIFQDEAPYFREWIEYHRMVGVDHFWLYNDRSTDDWEEVLRPFLDEGVVEVMDWSTGPAENFIGGQVSAYQDALRRSSGKTKWLALIDLDEFLLSPENRTIPECLEFYFPSASGVYANWRCFGTGGLYLKPGEPILSHLTAASDRLNYVNAIGKSIVRPDHVMIDAVWNIHHFVLQPGAQYYNGDAIPVDFREIGPERALDLRLDGKVHDKYLKINHYRMRDEHFFRNVRLPRAKSWGTGEALLWKHYREFSEEKDHEIIQFMRRFHLQQYEKIWKLDEDERLPLVTMHIMGQLGNNLFEVATASAHAWDHQTEATFPELDTAADIVQHVFFRCNTRPLLDKVQFEYQERSYAYNPLIFFPNMRLFGYFQSEKYFAHHRDRILELFSPRPDDLEYMKNKYSWLFSSNETVGVQIRDYTIEFPNGSIYPQYGKNYLEKAMSCFKDDALFVVSSNNLEFAKKSIPPWAKNVIFLENEPNYIDLYLLKFCKHNIITNSSFGWWAAWMNSNPGKIVIYPAYWAEGLPCQDVCPEEWIALQSAFNE